MKTKTKWIKKHLFLIGLILLVFSVIFLFFNPIEDLTFLFIVGFITGIVMIWIDRIKDFSKKDPLTAGAFSQFFKRGFGIVDVKK